MSGVLYQALYSVYKNDVIQYNYRPINRLTSMYIFYRPMVG